MIMTASVANDYRLLRALRRQSVDTTPIWIMRQAGRYLPEYRKLRAQAGDFLSLCKHPEWACEATLQPLKRFSLDAAILFSDILTIPDALGLGLYFEAGEGPRFRKPIRTEADVLALPNISMSALDYVMSAVSTCRAEMASMGVPLIGFSGSPWTLATYMVEGGSSKDFRRIKRMSYAQPEVLHQLLTKLTDMVIAYLAAQIAAGAQVVQVFDTWGGVLTRSAFNTFSLYYMKKIVQGVRALDKQTPPTPIILFTKNAGLWLEDLAVSGADALGVDWTIDLAAARTVVGEQVALQGNLDPAALYADKQTLRSEAANVLSAFGQDSGHVFNLGHGISQDVEPDKVKYLVDIVHELGAR